MEGKERSTPIQSLFKPIFACPLCRSKDGIIVQTGLPRLPPSPFFDVYRSEPTHLKRCSSCGFAYVDPLPTNSEFFDNLYKTPPGGANWDREFRFHGKTRVFEQVRRVLLRHCQGGRLLDVGAYCGTLINHLKNDFDVHGVELNASAAKHGRSMGLDIRTGSFDAADFDTGSIQVVTLVDVLEHLPQPESVIAKIRRVLASAGLLFIKVPNHDAQAKKQEILSRLGSSGAMIMQSYVHINGFSRPSLERHLIESGFEVLCSGFTPPETWNLRAPMPLRSRLRRVLANAAYLSITSLARRTSSLTGLELGFNLYVLARKC